MTGAEQGDRMRITLLALGSCGDVQPILALARALQADGYATRLATQGTFEGLVRDAGVDFAAVEGNPLAIVQDPSGRAWLETGRNPLAFARGFRDLMGPVLETAMRDGLEACRNADALLFSGPAYYIGYSIAQKRDIPYVQAYLQPVHATRSFPSAVFPLPTAGLGPLNYASHIVGGSLLWQLLLPAVNRARAAHLGLPPLTRMGPFP